MLSLINNKALAILLKGYKVYRDFSKVKKEAEYLTRYSDLKINTKNKNIDFNTIFFSDEEYWFLMSS